MIWFIGGLVLAALCIGFAVWHKTLGDRYLRELAARVRYYAAATDPWEEPTVIVNGGLHDYEKDGSGL